MSPDRSYPGEPVGGFPEPPLEIRIDADRTVLVQRFPGRDAGTFDGLVDMYADFDPADRAQGIPPIGRDRIREWLEVVLEQGPDVVARLDTRVIGHATLVPDGEAEFELAIFVHQDHRGHGVGSALLRALLGVGATMGIDYVWLSVERWNTIAIGLYESVGFETCDSGSFELEMSLRLAASHG